MDITTKSVVSMLASNDKLTLFTVTGEMVVITAADKAYDMVAISDYLTPKLTGTSAVDIDLTDYILKTSPLQNMTLEEEGIVIVQVINGKEVQGIFYPQKASVQVTVGESKVEIPNVENLSGHIKRATDEKSPSVLNFFKRLAPVIQDRKHSGEDLMMFIKRSDMPLTNDGRIIAYKRVSAVHGQEGVYTDVHSKSIKQRVGSRVTMAVDMVDSSRHNSCSTGLHVCNLGYLGGFSGSHTLIVLVDPANFIAVPHREYDKARVCSYDIVGVMSDEAHGIVNSGLSVKTDSSFEALIAAVINGDVNPPFEEVFAGQKTMLKVVPLTLEKKTTASKKTTNGKPLEPVVEQPQVQTKQVDILKQVRETKEKLYPTAIPDNVLRVFQMLVDGISLTGAARAAETSTRSIGRWIEKYGDPRITAIKPVQPQEVETVSQEDLEVTAEMSPQIISNLTQPVTIAEQARKLFNDWVSSGYSKNSFHVLRLFKAGKKKSWYSLGFSTIETRLIERHVGMSS